ncbi:MAG: hypothetical protein K6E10_11120 [Eubacterium sp.]|nr:hypothetical protein [Eubacterium sp.]
MEKMENSFDNFYENKDRSQKKYKKKRKIFIPTFTIILMLIFGIIGLIVFYGTYSTVKDCTSKVTGIVDQEGEGAVGTGVRETPQGKYLNTGKSGRYWIAITVNTDDMFKIETVYASRSYGSEGDRLAIHYNPENPDEYYIGEAKSQYGFEAAAVIFVIAALFLLLSIFFMIYYTVKGDTEEEEKGPEDEEEEKGPEDEEEELSPEEKEEEIKKKEKEAQRRKKIEENIDRKTKRYTKNYTNEHIRKQIQSDIMMAKTGIILLLIGIALILTSVVRTYIDIHADNQIPFNNYSDNIDDTFYSVVMEEKPQKVCSPDDGSNISYYDLKAGNDHILLAHVGNNILGMDGPGTLHGKLKRIRPTKEKTREIIKEYYQSIGYYDTLKDEEYAYYYLDCSEISFWDEMKNNHILGIVFGITIIIVATVFLQDMISMKKHLRPVYTGKRYRAKEIDRLANDIDTVWLNIIQVLVTPSALIGLNHGITVIEYGDIYGIEVNKIKHRNKYRKWETYKIFIETKKHRKILLTECELSKGYISLLQELDKRFVEYKLLDNK